MTTPITPRPEAVARKVAPSPRDLETEKQKYKTRLGDLTFNSKPIINMLTSAAQERIYAARQIVQAIEEHLRTVDPSIKLCVMYLIDSICKNVGGIYIPLFTRNMVHTFLEVYTVVDEETQGRLERVLGTWRHGPTGRPVFDLSLVASIEHGVAKTKSAFVRGNHLHNLPGQVGHIPLSMPEQQWPSSYGVSYQHDSHSSYPHTPVSSAAYSQGYPPNPTLPLPTPLLDALADRTSILSEMRALLSVTQQKAAQGDPMAAMRVGVLEQLQDVVQSQQLPASQLLQVKQHLSSLWAQAELTPTSTPPPSHQPHYTYAATPASVAQPAPPQHFNPQMPHYPGVSTITPVPIQRSPSATPPPAGRARVAAGIGPSGGVAMPPSDLVKNLMSFGLLTSVGSAANFGGGRTTDYPLLASSRKPETLADLGPIELTNESIHRRREGAEDLLYDAFPLQCKQCGFRFRKTPEGQLKMDEHLDWHFRQNRRAKDKAGKSQARGWFVGEEDWVHSREGEAANQEHAPFFDASQASACAETEAAKAEENALRQQTIVQPDAEAAGRPCPICKEAFENFFNDAEEEWYLRNAVGVGGVIYHATCHADVLGTGK